jgi:EAL domain-containing protein (putative c-di-GMP-specific phosphodiesterase class I)/GGDEF domain-containing protein
MHVASRDPTLPMFRRLGARLTVFYSGLFLVALAASAASFGRFEHRPGVFALIGVAVLGLTVLGSWALARRLTRPISALDEAVKRMLRGETARVQAGGHDEIASLAESINRMAADIAERERKIGHLALHDPHTGLPNRHALERHISSLLAKSRPFRLETLAPASDVFVMTLGIDRFAHVRGAIGHGLSGALIGAISARLLRLNPQLHVARLSTEVLGVAFEAEGLDQALAFAAQVQAALEEPLRLGENTIDVSLTVGMAAKGSSPGGVDLLVERADIALDQARAARQKIAVFDEAVYGDPAANLSLMSDLRRSIAAGDLLLHHQPKYDLRRRAVSGVEALVRWRHPARGMLPPDDFIGMAEETGHIRALTEWVLAQAIAEQRAMQRAGHDLSLSVNLSGRLLDDVAFADTALAMIAGACGPLCLEITETAVIENPELALAMIERYAAAGVAISIDDYGVGLSSLAYLQRIRADELKIDKSLVLTMADSQRDALLVRSTIDLAHGLGLKVTAEGVETEAVLSLLSAMGCDVAQGYHLARPMPLDRLLEHLADVAPQVRAAG